MKEIKEAIALQFMMLAALWAVSAATNTSWAGLFLYGICAAWAIMWWPDYWWPSTMLRRWRIKVTPPEDKP